MKQIVLDSYSLIAYAENEKGANEVAEILIDALEGRASVYISVINWGEMYYIALREGGKQRAEHYSNTFLKYPIEIIDAGLEHALTAANYKASYKMSYADAFAAGLAEMKKATLVTGDREFKPAEKKIKIHWI